MQNETFNKIKSIISIIFISIGLGFFGFCISTQGECTSKILPNYVQLTGAIKTIKTGEQQIKQTVIQSGQQTNTNYATNRIPKIKSSGTKQSTKSGKSIRHLGYSTTSYVQVFANYAYKISSGDLIFVALLDAENGQWNMYRKSMMIGSNGKFDYGLCQVNQGYHPEIVNNPIFWSDRKRQIQQCYRLYKGGTKFYGEKNIWKTIKRFIINK